MIHLDNEEDENKIPLQVAIIINHLEKEKEKEKKETNISNNERKRRKRDAELKCMDPNCCFMLMFLSYCFTLLAIVLILMQNVL
jgi:hypothetical protein